MKITLKQLTITNFKGIKSHDIKFGKTTFISGANRTGKTTVFDAFNWLLFGKSSDDRKSFEIKPLDENNQVIPMLENEVVGVFDIDGRQITIKRTHREKWVKKSGQTDKVFTGNEVIYEWNSVPVSMSEFNLKLQSLINEELFKLTTNPLYFNSLHWEKRRKMLIDLVGETEINLFDGLSKKDKGIIEKILNEGKNLLEAKKEISAKIKRIKSEMDLIPSRIDEANRAMPTGHSWDDLQKDLKAAELKLNDIESQIADESKAMAGQNEKYISFQKELNDIKIKMSNIENDTRSEFAEKKQKLENDLRSLNSELYNLQQEGLKLPETINKHERDLSILHTEKATMLDQYHKTNNSIFEFNENEKTCPTCGQELPNTTELIESAKLKFETSKKDRIEKLIRLGKEKAIDIAELHAKIDSSKSLLAGNTQKIEDLKITIDGVKSNISEIKEPKITNPDYGILQSKSIELQKILNETRIGFDNSELNDDKSNTISLIDEIKSILNNKAQIDSLNKRIEELKADESTKAQEIVSLEEIEFSIDAFNKNKMAVIENEVNKRFHFVKFKLFDLQINGGEKDTCDTLIKGVPFLDANTEGKINAGLDIINVFSENYKLFAPIFIDNKESVTTLIPIETQLICLEVDDSKKQLTIN